MRRTFETAFFITLIGNTSQNLHSLFLKFFLIPYTIEEIFR